MNTWFTSDQHFGHRNALEYCNRKFDNIDQYDSILIELWNDNVSRDDTVYHLGDFTPGGIQMAKNYFSQLNGNIHVLEYPWHHDKRWLNQFYKTRTGEVVYEKSIVVLEKYFVILCHYPFDVWDRKHYGALHFHGHSHGMLPKMPLRLDVGVDNAYKLLGEYRPFTVEEACKLAGETDK